MKLYMKILVVLLSIGALAQTIVKAKEPVVPENRDCVNDSKEPGV